MPTMTTTKHNLVFRPARLNDREPLMEWCHTLWGGETDYIEYVWEDWVRGGNLFIGTHPNDSTPMTLLRLRMLSADEAWFGGLRIHPALQGQGLGRMLIEWAQAWAIEQGASSLGYMTEKKNSRMHHLGERLGYQHKGIATWYESNAFQPKQLKTRSNLDLINLQSERLQAIYHGKIVFDWAYQRLDRARLVEHAQRNEVFIHPEGNSWIIIRVDQEPDEIHIEHLEGSPEQIRQLINHTLTLVSEGAHVLIPMWENDPWKPHIEQLGFNLAEPIFSFSIFERQLG